MSKIILSKNFIKSTCKLALNEDLYPSGDITSNLLKNNKKKNNKNNYKSKWNNRWIRICETNI